MNDNNNLTVLVAARESYTDHLCQCMYTPMIESLHDIYKEAHKMSDGNESLKQYQKLLREVPSWNNHIIQQHTEKIMGSCSHFENLLSAVFVSNVKILSSVRISNDARKIQIKLPTNEVFIHRCYVNAAKDIYADPFIIQEDIIDSVNLIKMTQRICECINVSIKELLPIPQILETYMSKDNEDVIFGGDTVDAPDPDIEDEEEEEEEEGVMEPVEELNNEEIGEIAKQAAPVNTEQVAPVNTEQAAPVNSEIREVSIPVSKEEPVDNDELFADSIE